MHSVSSEGRAFNINFDLLKVLEMRKDFPKINLCWTLIIQNSLTHNVQPTNTNTLLSFSKTDTGKVVHLVCIIFDPSDVDFAPFIRIKVSRALCKYHSCPLTTVDVWVWLLSAPDCG